MPVIFGGKAWSLVIGFPWLVARTISLSDPFSSVFRSTINKQIPLVYVISI